MKIFKHLFITLLVVAPFVLFAQDLPVSSAFIKNDTLPKTEITKAFRYYKNIMPSGIIPAVTEVSLTKDFFSLPVFAVYDLNTESFEPYLFLEKKTSLETSARLLTNLSEGSSTLMNDGDLGTFYEFPLPPNYIGSNAQIVFLYDKTIRSSSLSVNFSQNVAFPKKVSIYAKVDGKEKTVLAPTPYYGNNISFPETTSDYWVVVFEHEQPLRISEIKFTDLDASQLVTKNLRFLAQPEHKYQLYFDADRQIRATTKEAGDLANAERIIYPSFSGPLSNPEYQPVDSDADGVVDSSDNCVNVSNPDQKDEDHNGRGDVCEDYDNDNILNSKDNCPQIPNQAQTDTDKDGVGDACDKFDNRITERMPWLPWVGIGIAGIVLVGLFIIALNHKREDSQ